MIYTNPYNSLKGNLPENINKWIESHKDNLVSDDNLDGNMTGFSKSWIFNPKNFNETYVEDEIYPFITLADYKYFTVSVQVH